MEKKGYRAAVEFVALNDEAGEMEVSRVADFISVHTISVAFGKTSADVAEDVVATRRRLARDTAIDRADFQKGFLVETWFDTGAGKMGGPRLIYGRVVSAGAKTATIEWESGIRNRVPNENGSCGVEVARNQSLAKAVVEKAESRRRTA